MNWTQIKKNHMKTFEYNYLEGVLIKHKGSPTLAAKSIGLDRSNFLKLLRKLKIKAVDYRENKV